jgi:hypothetical protein
MSINSVTYDLNMSEYNLSCEHKTNKQQHQHIQVQFKEDENEMVKEVRF